MIAREARTDAVGSPRAASSGKRRAGKNREAGHEIGARRLARSLALMRRCVAGSKPFVALTMMASGEICGKRLGENFARVRGRHGADDDVRVARELSATISGWRDAAGISTPGKIGFVFTSCRDGLASDAAFATHRAISWLRDGCRRKNNGQRRAPASAAKNGDLCHSGQSSILLDGAETRLVALHQPLKIGVVFEDDQ